MADAGAAAASVGVFRCCSHEADAPREAALLEALAQHDVAAATTDLDAIRLDFADGAAPAGQAFYALYSAASARSIATYARGRRPPHRCPDPRPPPELNGACCWRSATAVVEWLLSRPGDPQAGGAERALVIPSIRALQLGRSKLGCHAALSKAGLPAARTVAVLSPAGAASAAESLCAASGGCFHAREDCGGRWLVGGGGERELRSAAELLEAIGAADPPPSYPLVLQAWPDADARAASAYGRVRLLYVDHKLESVSGLVGGSAGEEAFRAHARPFLTELAGFLDRNDVALAQIEVAVATDPTDSAAAAAQSESPHCQMCAAPKQVCSSIRASLAAC
jgi:hypothetical protein